MFIFNSKKLLVLLFGGIISVICCSCFSTADERRLVVEEIINQSEMREFYATKSYFALLPDEQRTKYVRQYTDAIADFYVNNLTMGELESLLAFQEEPVIKRVRRNMKNSQETTNQTLDDVWEISEQYSVVQKIASEDFQNKMLEYIKTALEQK